MAETQTFIEPVSDVIERLSAAAWHANNQHTRVELKLTWLGVLIVVSSSNNLRRSETIIGWLEINQGKANLLINAIDIAVAQFRRS